MKTAHSILQQYWGYTAFRPLQKEIIDSVIAAHDVLALLPTGGGKSLCFQVPALMLPDLTLVISPLVALMQDQVQKLKHKGVAAAAIYAGMPKEQVDQLLDEAVGGHLKLLYLSPERLQSEQFRARLPYLKVSLFAVDEAHCISSWGHDFRPAYRQFRFLRKNYPKVPVIALTATATPDVQQDILSQLDMPQAKIWKKSFARPLLSYRVVQSHFKINQVKEALDAFDGPAMLYASTRKATEQLAGQLQRLGFAAEAYHAGLPVELRKQRQQAWLKEAIRVMVATSAFGMGIDKPNVRLVLHWTLPASLEAYYQEAGRAGRDGTEAWAILFYDETDGQRLIHQAEEANASLDALQWWYQCLANAYQVAIGSHPEEAFPFDMEDLAALHQITPTACYHLCKQLEAAGLIQLQDSYIEPAKIKLKLHGKQLYHFQVAQPSYVPLLRSLHQTYGGDMVHHYQAISLKRIARLMRTTLQRVNGWLHDLVDLGVVVYQPQQKSAKLAFLTPRYASQHLPIDMETLTKRAEKQKEKVEKIIEYAQSHYLCRSQRLQTYFGEIFPKRCQHCDNCLQRRGKRRDEEHAYQKYRHKILALLEEAPLSIEQLMGAFPCQLSGQIKQATHLMIEQEEVALDSDWHLTKQK